MSEETYGFIGLGNMGTPMAGRLLDAGYPLAVYDTNRDAVARLQARGARACASLREVADTTDTVFLSLPTPEIVQQVAAGADGLAGGTRIRRVVDLSTIGPRVARQVAQALGTRDILYVDAPVSGGVGGAQRGTLAVMAACPRDHYEALEPVLKHFGPVFYLGQDAGIGQTMKLANNLLSAAAVAITSEAMAMGVKAGLDAAVMLDVINAGSGRNTATQDKFPKAVLPGTFDIGFAARLAYKDVRLCVDEAEAIGVPMVVGSAVREMLVLTTTLCGEQADFTHIAKVVETWGGVPIRGKS
ncbi:NAD(P)-dependent oxidoreductase [Bordetella sp. BOR01]|uniref:NAD(P)-dependent oxidoreductase n=1 Tax=Bordetella sp. BOR01 TaxID=2854779 RepID=UPI001C48DC5C|nr:NAD(P)-dependent oxidoreductase [Bordetella sp. BOR01]MBV7486240.1 NAD(P)-dependent oxidoreductase [Bordetella sp. BOR01]